MSLWIVFVLCVLACVLGYWLGRRLSVVEEVEAALLKVAVDRAVRAQSWVDFQQSGMRKKFEDALKERR